MLRSGLPDGVKSKTASQGAFFADDGYNISPGGKKITGKQELRTLIGDGWIPENVQAGVARNVKLQDGKTILLYDISTKWCNELGVSPSQVINIVTIEDNKIKSVNAYYTLPSIEKMMKACDAQPDSKMPNGAPCGKGIPVIKKYTDSLVAQGIAEKE